MVWRIIALSFAFLAAAPPAMAHPHAWIDLRSKVLLDEDGRIRALQQEWVFDDYYTVALGEEIDIADPDAEKLWTDVAGRNLANLADHDYFTVIKLDGEPVALGKVETYQGGLRDGRMWMRFELPLQEPVDPRVGEVAFSIYDPSYYIEMVHLEGDLIAFEGPGEGAGADRCTGEIIQPAPTFEQVSLAAALDKDATAADGLGALFAETVILSCS